MKLGRLPLLALTLGCGVAAVLMVLGRVWEAPLPVTEPAGPTGTTATADLPPTGQASSSRAAAVRERDDPHPTSGALDSEIIAQLERCIVGSTPGERAALLGCLDSIEMESLSAERLAAWACATSFDYSLVSSALASRVARVEATEVLSFIEQFQSHCDRFRETSLTIGCLAYGRHRSEQWYRSVAEQIDAARLLSSDGNESIIQLAESFVQDGDPMIAGLLEDLGMGLFGGTERQIFRASLISIVNKTEPQARFDYIRALASTPGSSVPKLGHHFAKFLTDGSTWVGGSATDSLALLESVLHDPRFSVACARQIVATAHDNVPGESLEQWSAIAEEAALIVKRSQ